MFCLLFIVFAGLLGCLPLSVSLLVSPLTVSYCRRRSIRLTAVLGGLVSSLALLFASFAVQYHQVVLSYGVILGEMTILITSYNLLPVKTSLTFWLKIKTCLRRPSEIMVTILLPRNNVIFLR